MHVPPLRTLIVSGHWWSNIRSRNGHLEQAIDLTTRWAREKATLVPVWSRVARSSTLELKFMREGLFTRAGVVLQRMRLVICSRSFRSRWGDHIALDYKLAENISSRYLENSPVNMARKVLWRIIFPHNLSLLDLHLCASFWALLKPIKYSKDLLQYAH